MAIQGRFQVLDWVSRPDVFAALHPPLVQGYGLDALETDDGGEPPSIDEAEAFLAELTDAPTSESDGIGLGRDLELESAHLVGDGQVADRELVQLTVFAASGSQSGTGAGGARIERPSRRRR